MTLKFFLPVVLVFLKKMVHFKMEDYKIGVLLSAYNGEKYITQQVQSIMNQNNVSNITLLIRNDGSTDRTSCILNKLKEKYSNLVLIEGKNIGLTASFFTLLDTAVRDYNFDYYSFSDQDDYWLKDKLEKAVKLLQTNNQNIPVLYGCRSKVVDENLKPTGFLTQPKLRDITFYNTAIQNIVIGHNQVLNKKMAQVLMDHKPDFKQIYSQDLWITNVAVIMGKVLFDNTAHTFYRMHGKNALGYGKNKLNRLYGHLKRLQKNESKKMAIQLNYFVQEFSNYLTPEELNEMRLFFISQNSFKNRINYLKKTKLYRQEKKENILFKLLYLLGSYDI